MNKKIYLLSLSVIAVFFIAQSIALSAPFRMKADNLNQSDSEDKISELFLFDKNDAEILSEQLNDKELPVGSTEVHLVENPEGVVVFIPQTHINPGTKIEDQANDSAEVAQKEIYRIIDHLNEKTNVDFIMLEGEKYGLASSEKTDKVSEKMRIRNELIASSEKLQEELSREAVPSEKTKTLLVEINKTIAYLDREIALQGAPYKVKAENEEVIIYGSENPDTYEKSSVIVKNYIYQKDRLKAIQRNNGGSKVAANPSSADMIAQMKEKILNQKNSLGITGSNSEGMTKLESLKKLLSGIRLDNSFDMSAIQAMLGKQNGDPIKSPSFHAALEEINAIGVEKDNEEICGIVQEIKKDCNDLEEVRNQKPVTTATTPVSDRSVNPYSSINDEAELNKEIKATESQIQEVVIDKRNRETAENFKAALAETGNELGVLQFGAGHEEGLIAELNKQGLSVVVVKPKEVLRRELTDKE